MVTLAAFETVLHRYTGQRSIVVGVPVANRNRLSAEPLIGTLVNTLPLRIEVDPEATFLDLLRTVRDASLDAFAHQDLPLERLVTELQVERVAGQTPLFPVMFDFLNVPMPLPHAGGLRLRPLTFSRRASQFDLSLVFLDTELGRVGALEYRTDLYEAATIRRLAGHYRAVLEAVVAEPQARLDRIQLLTPAERSGSSPGPRPPAPAPRPGAGAPAVRGPGGPHPRRPGGGRRQPGPSPTGSSTGPPRPSPSGWRALGAGPGQRVAICLERSRAVVVALLATPPDRRRLPAPRPALPGRPDPLRPGGRRARRSWWRTRPPWRTLAVPPGVAVVHPRGRGRWRRPTPRTARPPRRPRRRPAYVIYTSGSTGPPQGRRGPPRRARPTSSPRCAASPGLVAADRILAVTTISFDIAGLEIFLPLVRRRPRRARRAADVVADGRRAGGAAGAPGATVMQATPATWRMLLDAGWRGDGRLKLLVGGEALPRGPGRPAAGAGRRGLEPVRAHRDHHLVHAPAGGAPATAPIPIGRPIDQHPRLRPRPPAASPCPDGVPGELYIGGAGVARGYLGPARAHRRALPPRPLRRGPAPACTAPATSAAAGTTAPWSSSAASTTRSRSAASASSSGEIEAVLARARPASGDAVVVAREDRPATSALVAYLVARREAPAPVRGAPRAAAARLPGLHGALAASCRSRRCRSPPTARSTARPCRPRPPASAAEEERPVPPRDAVEVAIARAVGGDPGRPGGERRPPASSTSAATRSWWRGCSTGSRSGPGWPCPSPRSSTVRPWRTSPRRSGRASAPGRRRARPPSRSAPSSRSAAAAPAPPSSASTAPAATSSTSTTSGATSTRSGRSSACRPRGPTGPRRRRRPSRPWPRPTSARSRRGSRAVRTT